MTEATRWPGLVVYNWAIPTPWARGKTYSSSPPASSVTWEGSTYVCNTSHTSGLSFGGDASKWTLIAAGGVDGVDGAGGLTGAVSVTDPAYGAKYDGVTDNTDAFIRCFDENKYIIIPEIPGGDAAVFDVTGMSASGGYVTLTYDSTLPCRVGTYITVSGCTPSGLNGTFPVMSTSAGSVTFENATTGPLTVAGQVSIGNPSYLLTNTIRPRPGTVIIGAGRPIIASEVGGIAETNIRLVFSATSGNTVTVTAEDADGNPYPYFTGLAWNRRSVYVNDGTTPANAEGIYNKLVNLGEKYSDYEMRNCVIVGTGVRHGLPIITSLNGTGPYTFEYERSTFDLWSNTTISNMLIVLSQTYQIRYRPDSVGSSGINVGNSWMFDSWDDMLKTNILVDNVHVHSNQIATDINCHCINFWGYCEDSVVNRFIASGRTNFAYALDWASGSQPERHDATTKSWSPFNITVQNSFAWANPKIDMPFPSIGNDLVVNSGSAATNNTWWNEVKNGQAVTVAGSNLPSPLQAATTYYVIKRPKFLNTARTESSIRLFQLAATQADALVGKAIHLDTTTFIANCAVTKVGGTVTAVNFSPAQNIERIRGFTQAGCVGTKMINCVTDFGQGYYAFAGDRSGLYNIGTDPNDSSSELLYENCISINPAGFGFQFQANGNDGRGGKSPLTPLINFGNDFQNNANGTLQNCRVLFTHNRNVNAHPIVSSFVNRLSVLNTQVISENPNTTRNSLSISHINEVIVDNCNMTMKRGIRAVAIGNLRVSKTKLASRYKSYSSASADNTYGISVFGTQYTSKLHNTPVYGRRTIIPTGASGTGSTATITFAGSWTPEVGRQVTITSMTPAGYNGTHTITASAPGSVSFASTTTGTLVTPGSLTFVGSETVNMTVLDGGVYAHPVLKLSSTEMVSGGTGYAVNDDLTIAGGTQATFVVTGASGTGSTATLTFDTFGNPALAIPVNSTAVVSGMTPAGYNGTHTVTATTSNSISFASTESGAFVSGGTIATVTRVRVTAVSGGVITAVTVRSPGALVALPTEEQIAENSVTGGTGTGAKIELEFNMLAIWVNTRITAATGDGTTATITFLPAIEVPVGTIVNITGVGIGSYNGTFTVTASTAGTVSFASTETATGSTTGRLNMGGTGFIDDPLVDFAFPPESHVTYPRATAILTDSGSDDGEYVTSITTTSAGNDFSVAPTVFLTDLVVARPGSLIIYRERGVVTSASSTTLTDSSKSWSIDQWAGYKVTLIGIRGTATAGSGTTLTDSTRTWTTNQWTDYNLVIVSGTGVGQTFRVSTNTATVLTIAGTWTTTPDATSVFELRGNGHEAIVISNTSNTLTVHTAWTAPVAGDVFELVGNITLASVYSNEQKFVPVPLQIEPARISIPANATVRIQVRTQNLTVENSEIGGFRTGIVSSSAYPAESMKLDNVDFVGMGNYNINILGVKSAMIDSCTFSLGANTPSGGSDYRTINIGSSGAPSENVTIQNCIFRDDFMSRFSIYSAGNVRNLRILYNTFLTATQPSTINATSSAMFLLNTTKGGAGYEIIEYGNKYGPLVGSRIKGSTNGVYTEDGAVTQATSKSTNVPAAGTTMDTRSGTITMNGATLNADTTVSFVFTNAGIAADDFIRIWHDSVGTLGSYSVYAIPANGSATIYVRNITPGNLSEAIVLKYRIMKRQ